MSNNIKTPSRKIAGAADDAAAKSVHDEVRPLDEPVDPIEVAESIPEEVEGAGEVIRQSAELALEQARTSYERMRQAAEEATANIEAAVAAASSGVTELNQKAFEALKTSSDATFEFVRAMSGARTFSDVVSLQTEHMRAQFETMNAQVRDFAELASKVSARTLAPLRDTVGKSFGVPG